MFTALEKGMLLSRPTCHTQEWKSDGMCTDFSTAHIDFEYFLVWRYFVWVVFGMLGLFVVCTLLTSALIESAKSVQAFLGSKKVFRFRQVHLLASLHILTLLHVLFSSLFLR